MTHVVHPYAHRLVVLRDWKSRWFATGKDYRNNLKVDVLLREYLQKKLKGMYVSSIEFERNTKTTRLILRTSRPGMIIGRNGENAAKIRVDIAKKMKKIGIEMKNDFKLDIIEIPNPDADSAVIAANAVEMLEKRMQFRRVMKMLAEKVMATKGVKGFRIVLAGRLGGAEMARREEVKRGSIPLQFIRADIDYAHDTALLPYGGIGIKVWIYKGDSLVNKEEAKK